MKKFVAVVLALVMTLSLCACNSLDYKEAMELYEDESYERARELFVELGDYENSAEMVNQCDYQLALEHMEDGEYEEAKALFVELDTFEDSAEKVVECNYEIAQAALEAGEYQQAYELFLELGDYKDSAEMAKECRNKEIDALLQGHWEAVNSGLVFNYKFVGGRFEASLSVGANSISNEGSYRIDTESGEIYVCYGYTFSSSGTKTPNTEEQLLFTYTYDGSSFTLTNSTGETVTKK